MVHETRKEGEVLEKVLSQKTGRNVLKKPPVIEIKNVKKVYRMGSERISAVDDVRENFAVCLAPPVPESQRF